MVLIRNPELTQFVLFEEEIRQVIPSNYEWQVNKSGNFEGYDIQTKQHRFTWQPHGSQFTIMMPLPGKVFKFLLRKPAALDEKSFLVNLQYGKDWLHLLSSTE